MDRLLEETAGRILADHGSDPVTLWATLEENGLTRLWVGEADGGFDLGPVDGFGLIRLAGRHAAPVPLADSLVASWFLTEAGLSPPAGAMTILIDGFQHGTAIDGAADHVVRVRGRTVTLHRAADAPAQDGDAIMMGEMAHDHGLSFAALARAAQICGALEAVLDLTIGFAEQRIQFGRSLSKFQAIQHLLSEMGAEAAAASAALDAAVTTVRRGPLLDATAVAVAKYRAGLAATIASEHAHQVHGAIGYTQEYELGRLTRRLWQWREDFGGESYWAMALGRAALDDSRPLWERLTEQGDAL